MIKIESYTAEFEEIYWKTVQGKVSSNTQDYILNSSLKFMPGDFWNGATPTFKELILAPFEKLKKHSGILWKIRRGFG